MDTTLSPAENAVQAPATLLCVDDEANILSALRRLFRTQGYKVLIAESGAAGLNLLREQTVDLVISDMRMPEMDGACFLEQVRANWPDTVRILLTGYADISSTVAAINKGEIYRYINKPWDDQEVSLIIRQALERKELEREKARLEALTQRQNDELKDLNANLENLVAKRTEDLRVALSSVAQANEKLKASFFTSIKVFSNLIELREGTLAGHSRRVADLARRIAIAMGLEQAEVQNVMLAGLLHDIGKIGLADDMLAKPPNRMQSEELLQHNKHCIVGESVLMALEQLRPAAKLIRSHHERFDGLGFPDGLSGLSIPVGARILALANDFDALQIGTFSGRRLSEGEARSSIEQQGGQRYDPKVVECFLKLVSDPKPSTAAVELAVAVEDLVAGMVLTRDLHSRSGVLLLAADYILDAGLIRQIQDFERTEDNGRIAIYVRPDSRR